MLITSLVRWAASRRRAPCPVAAVALSACLVLATGFGACDKVVAATVATPVLAPGAAPLTESAIEPRLRLDTQAPGHAQDVVLTLDACSGGFDARLIDLLVAERLPATLFVTRRWLDANPSAARQLLAHPDLFEFEDHGDAHVPLVVGRRLYGLKGVRDAAAAEREVAGGAEAIHRLTGQAPRWFRGAGAAYDALGQAVVERQGLRIAGFSVNGDDGARLPAAGVARRLALMRPGDIVLAHMNHPGSGTADGLARALPRLKAQGLRFVRLSQAAGVVALPGKPQRTRSMGGAAGAGAEAESKAPPDARGAEGAADRHRHGRRREGA